jgi:transcriptional regulator with XRE-family HTH domain
MTSPKGLREFRRSLAVTVRERRQARGWTQEDMATEAGLTQPAISNYERDAKEMRLTSLLAIASAFEVLPETLLEEARTRAAGERAA